MILFKPEHVEMILNGNKTQTRRLGKKRWNVGAIHQCKTKLYSYESFACVRILEVRQEYLHDISEADIGAEGYGLKPGDYKEAWARINGGEWYDYSYTSVWVVTFELVQTT